MSWDHEKSPFKALPGELIVWISPLIRLPIIDTRVSSISITGAFSPFSAACKWGIAYCVVFLLRMVKLLYKNSSRCQSRTVEMKWNNWLVRSFDDPKLSAVFRVPSRTSDVDHAIRGSVTNGKRPGSAVLEWTSMPTKEWSWLTQIRPSRWNIHQPKWSTWHQG